MKKAFKIVEIVFISILIFLIILFGYYIISRLVNKNNYSRMFGYYMFEVTSGSMYNPEEEDSLNVGSLVFVKPNKNGEYKVGQTITFKRPDDKHPITHKIIEVDGDMLTTKGINPSNSPDSPFNKQYVIGEVKSVWQNYAKTINFIKSPMGISVVLIVGLGLFIGIDVLHKFVKKQEKPKEENLPSEDNPQQEENPSQKEEELPEEDK